MLGRHRDGRAVARLVRICPLVFSIPDKRLSSAVMSKENLRNLRVLLVEGNPDDVFLFQKVAQVQYPNWHVDALGSVVQAKEWLSPSSIQPIPDLLITALLLPLESGCDLIAWVRLQPRFQRLFVLVLSDSMDLADRKRALALGANLFIEKSADLSSVLATISRAVEGSEPQLPAL